MKVFLAFVLCMCTAANETGLSSEVDKLVEALKDPNSKFSRYLVDLQEVQPVRLQRLTSCTDSSSDACCNIAFWDHVHSTMNEFQEFSGVPAKHVVMSFDVHKIGPYNSGYGDDEPLHGIEMSCQLSFQMLKDHPRTKIVLKTKIKMGCTPRKRVPRTHFRGENDFQLPLLDVIGECRMPTYQEKQAWKQQDRDRERNSQVMDASGFGRQIGERRVECIDVGGYNDLYVFNSGSDGASGSGTGKP